MEKETEKQKSIWHLIKIDDDSFNLLKQKRDKMREKHHASYGDAIRLLIEHDELYAHRRKSDEKLLKSDRPKLPRLK